MRTVPVSVVIPTKDRPESLVRTIQSLLASTFVPAEFVIVDASEKSNAAAMTNALFEDLVDGPRLIVQSALKAGAAVQRNQAVALAENDAILFCDDDIICEPDCIERLWTALQSAPGIGGASAAIVNQSYTRPGFLLRMVLAALGGHEGNGYAGRIVGPVIAFLPSLPADNAAAPDAVPMQWLNLGCTLYRRRYLPEPPFDPHFQGYSIGEDISLSLRVAKRARLVNVPAARIYHDSQPGLHKVDGVARSRMDVVNRYYIMTQVMEAGGRGNTARMLLWECCQLTICALQQRGGLLFWQRLWGKLLGLRDIMRVRPARHWR